MAFPTIPTSGAGRIISAANTSPAGTHTFPSLTGLTKNSGDLLIAIVVTYDGNTTNAEFSSWGGGFTEFVDQATTATMGIGAAYKWSTGSETGTFTVTSSDTSTNDSQCILLSIPGAHASTPPEGGTIGNGTTGSAAIAALNPTGWDAEDTLWIAVCGAGETSTTGSFTAPSAAPTNYSGLFATAVSADVVGGVYGAVAFRQLNAASEDPATFTVDTSNARNSALLIAVRPAVLLDSPALEASSFGTFTGVGSGDTINSVKVSLDHKEDAAAAAPTVELWDGTTAQIGTTRTGTSNTADHTDEFTFTGVTYSQLATLRVRIYGHSPTTITTSVDAVSLTVNYVSNAADATVTPPVVAAVAGVPAPTITRTATVALAGAVAVVAAVAAPAIQTAGNAVVTPPVVVAVAGVPVPTVIAPNNATPAPPTVAAVGSVGAMTGAIATTVDVVTVAAVAGIPAPTVQTAGNATVTPPVVARAVVIPAPTITRTATKVTTTVTAVASVGVPVITRSATAAPPVVAGVAAVGVPTITRTATVPAIGVAGTVAVPVPTVLRSATVPATTVPAVASVPAPSIQAGAGTTVAATAVSGVASVPAPTILRSATVPATSVPVVGAVNAPSIQAGAGATVAAITVAATAAVPVPTIICSATVVTTTVAGVATVNVPVILRSATVLPPTVQATASVPVVVVDTGAPSSSPFYLYNGVTEEPLAMTVWNGSTEVPLVSFEIAP